MAERVALLCKIHMTKDKPMKYPDFNTMCAAVLNGEDWCYYVDRHNGPHLDKKSKLKEGDAPGDAADDGRFHNPDPLMQRILYIVPEEFALLAVAADPLNCEIIPETDAATFWDTRGHAHEAEEQVDRDRIEAIKSKHGITGAFDPPALDKLTDDEKDALDPAKPTPGIRKNHNRYFSDFKTKAGITIKDPA